MKTFKMNIHQGLSFTVNTETLIETYNLSHENRESKNMYIYYVLSKKIDDHANYHFDFYEIKHRVMELKTDEGELLVHRFASQNLNDLERFITLDLNRWFTNNVFQFIKIDRNNVEVKYISEANRLDCEIFAFTNVAENFN